MVMFVEFGGLFWMICVFVLVLLIIVIVYEYGYYIIGCLFGIKVEVFLLGFGFCLLLWCDKCGMVW